MQPPEPGAKTKMRVFIFLCPSFCDKDAEMDEIELFVEEFIRENNPKQTSQNYGEKSDR